MAKKAQKTAWRNRIVGHGEVAPASLQPSPLNWRMHPLPQKSALAGALAELGWIQQIVVNRATKNLIDGHLRLALALEHHEPTVPVLYVDLSEEEERLALATLDPIGMLAEADRDVLSQLLAQVQSDVPAVQQMLSALAERQGIIPSRDVDNPLDHWQGMPDFHQDDQLGVQQVIVHFAAEEDVAAFAALMKQPITPKTKYLWYPQQERVTAQMMQSDESA